MRCLLCTTPATPFNELYRGVAAAKGRLLLPQILSAAFIVRHGRVRLLPQSLEISLDSV